MLNTDTDSGIVFDGGLSCRNKLIIMSQVSKQTIARVSGLFFTLLVCVTVSSPHPSFLFSPCSHVLTVISPHPSFLSSPCSHVLTVISPHPSFLSASQRAGLFQHVESRCGGCHGM